MSILDDNQIIDLAFKLSHEFDTDYNLTATAIEEWSERYGEHEPHNMDKAIEFFQDKVREQGCLPLIKHSIRSLKLTDKLIASHWILSTFDFRPEFAKELGDMLWSPPYEQKIMFALINCGSYEDAEHGHLLVDSIHMRAIDLWNNIVAFFYSITPIDYYYGVNHDGVIGWWKRDE